MTKIVPPGHHLLIDFWGCQNLTDQAAVEAALREAAAACGATVLQVVLHGFGEGAGITGMAILAESHISIHTWPELDYVALDVFMCGACDPQLSLSVFRASFTPKKERINLHVRGQD
jgi:S-adenosylmethionine decarboxylase